MGRHGHSGSPDSGIHRLFPDSWASSSPSAPQTLPALPCFLGAVLGLRTGPRSLPAPIGLKGGLSVSGLAGPSCRLQVFVSTQACGPWLQLCQRVLGTSGLCCRRWEGTAPQCGQPLDTSPSFADFSHPAHASVTSPFIDHPFGCAVFLLGPCPSYQAHHFMELSLGFCKMRELTVATI